MRQDKENIIKSKRKKQQGADFLLSVVFVPPSGKIFFGVRSLGLRKLPFAPEANLLSLVSLPSFVDSANSFNAQPPEKMQGTESGKMTQGNVFKNASKAQVTVCSSFHCVSFNYFGRFSSVIRHHNQNLKMNYR